uniref:protein CHROMATIN REMODELING 8 isoform X1 n=1 Tax=Erigeron canadensis TaxID=72917 RepID=UPI001CB99005|nr:protein CHROMATIN REMODELING 8 isoform X1 [Erigeron canadensis]
MKEEEVDRALLSSLGVTSANPDEIEQDILQQARNHVEQGSEVGGTADHEHLERRQNSEPSSTARTDVLNRLRAINVEIDAVACTVEDVKNFSRAEDDNDNEQGGLDAEQSILQASSNDLTLQQALATDRLESLKRTKAQLEKHIASLGDEPKSNKDEKILRSIVKEEPKLKRKQKELPPTNKKLKKRHKTVAFNDDDEFDAVLNAASAGFIETERDELVRKGILTPFHNLKGYERRIEEPGPSNTIEEDDDLPSTSIARAVKLMSEAAQSRPTSKLLDSDSLPGLDMPARPFQRLRTPFKNPQFRDSVEGTSKDSTRKKKRPLPEKRWRKVASREDNNLLEGIEDARGSSIEEDNQEDVEDGGGNEASFVTLEGGLKIPDSIFSQLFDYQKVGVQWLWELHCQRAGGIIGDEMGLGKTIQVLSFLGALHFSKMYKPSIIVCPVTLLRQWRREAKKWYPSFHVEILHDSAQDSSAKRKQIKSDESDDDTTESDEEEILISRKDKKWDSLINRVLRSESGLLITTYEQLRILGEKLLDIEWGYAVLDEGHRIRNPNAEVTLVCKQLQTVHRIIMTGAPIQNKLSELWSLFDFVFPGKLGVLPVFEAEFAVPISVGGYANASPLQVSTAYRCAVVLRDLIMPYLLRRMKADVNAHLPTKTEHVLFCSLTSDQRATYRAFLASSEVEQIFNGDRNSLYGIDVMRKICNHPDLLERETAAQNPDYGNPERSGKMKVVAQVLKVWKEQGHRVLLFAQTQQMLDILENFLINDSYTYRRMDGLTPVKQRMSLMDEFNNSSDIFIFILTTKVGGLGTNLTGANRVIIFDPDWNPSTDMQARERAWRIGQTKDVTVYRLITRGTIEEKVYHRQIYKHFLTNKILKNPQQKRFFKARDMKDLFTLNDDRDNGSTETSNLFGQLSENVNIVAPHLNNQDIQGLNGAAIAKDNDLSTGTKKSKKKDKEKVDDTNGGETEETNILKSLFDAQGIHSAVNHDLIMNANDEEKVKLDEQASQVARRAAEALRQSRMIRSQESISVPTWTGRSGTAGAPGSSSGRKFGSTVNSKLVTKIRTEEVASNNERFVAGASGGKALSSSELLAKLRGTQEQAVGDALEHQLGVGSSSNGRTRSSHNLVGVQPEVLIRQICTFLQQRGGISGSASIVQHFKDRIPEKDLPVFKSLLKEIATLQKNPNGSSWILKPEYQ